MMAMGSYGAYQAQRADGLRSEADRLRAALDAERTANAQLADENERCQRIMRQQREGLKELARENVELMKQLGEAEAENERVRADRDHFASLL